jgi:hypothetical protein
MEIKSRGANTLQCGSVDGSIGTLPEKSHFRYLAFFGSKGQFPGYQASCLTAGGEKLAHPGLPDSGSRDSNLVPPRSSGECDDRGCLKRERSVEMRLQAASFLPLQEEIAALQMRDYASYFAVGAAAELNRNSHHPGNHKV